VLAIFAQTVLLALGAATLLGAQTAPAEFEVAVVKPYVPPASQPGSGRKAVSESGMRGGPGTNSPGQVTWTGSIQSLILTVYRLQHYQLVAPEWTNTELFTIVAKVPEGATRNQMFAMWGTLLQQRFGLETHRAPKEVAVYELSIAKSGPKLELSPDPPVTPAAGPPKWTEGPNGCPISADGRKGGSMGMVPGRFRICAARMTITELVRALTGLVDRPLIDKTGLAAAYDFKLEFHPQAFHDGQDTWPPLEVALPAQLGLKLEPAKSSVEALIVDRIERTPTDN